MSIDPRALSGLVARHGIVRRVVVVETRGSAPREPGAAMLLWEGGQQGTIGGGRLEWEAAAAAQQGYAGLSRHALGPDLGQCCGGSVTLWTETWDAPALAAADLSGPVVARGPGEQPLGVGQVLARLDRGLPVPLPAIAEGWIVEALAPAAAPLWIWGAGHVGRALVDTLAPLPDVSITWIDDDAARFPAAPQDGALRLVAADMPRAAAQAPDAAWHLIVSYSHAIDLALCHALLSRPAAGIGLIGSATKWARFRSRLRALGHSNARMSRISCPIGDPSLGKHPQAIAIGVAARLLLDLSAETRRMAG